MFQVSIELFLIFERGLLVGLSVILQPVLEHFSQRALVAPVIATLSWIVPLSDLALNDVGPRLRLLNGHCRKPAQVMTLRPPIYATINVERPDPFLGHLQYQPWCLRVVNVGATG